MNQAQQLLPTIEPSEQDLYEMALSVPLDEKIDKAVKLLRGMEQMALAVSPDGYWLAYSGGKDSDVILELAKMAGVKYRAVYNVTTIDPPELVRYIKREHSDVEFNHPEKCLFTVMVEHPACHGPPTRLARWCCKYYKEHGGSGMVKIIGVRAPESPRRKALWRTVMPNRNGGHILCPIVYWTDDDVWAFHRLRGLPYCELYDEGFKRLGCVGCPLAGANLQRKTLERWPKYQGAWKRATKRFWDKWHGVPKANGEPRWFEDFGSWEGLWEWWISGGPKQDSEDDGCQMEFLWQ